MSRADVSARRRRAWHAAKLREARIPVRRLAAAFDWLRVESRLAGQEAMEQSTQLLLARAAELNKPTPPAPATSSGEVNR